MEKIIAKQMEEFKSHIMTQNFQNKETCEKQSIIQQDEENFEDIEQSLVEIGQEFHV